jgi:hypothetical protein
MVDRPENFGRLGLVQHQAFSLLAGLRMPVFGFHQRTGIEPTFDD